MPPSPPHGGPAGGRNGGQAHCHPHGRAHPVPLSHPRSHAYAHARAHAYPHTGTNSGVLHALLCGRLHPIQLSGDPRPADAFEAVVGDDTAYPFSNTVDIFAQDEMTLVNLECSLSDLEGWSASTFSFLAPASAVDILIDGSVEFATMANNHALDFGQAIYDDTAAVLDGAGIGHAGEGEGVLYTTDNGLVVGIYAVHNGHYPDANAVAQAVRDLKEAGAEIVVVSAHWGNEASYYQNENQTAVAHAAIDAGASIVVGHGPHRLQPMEEYNGGVIFYSLSNWVFGGNTLPADMDTVIGQVTIRRDLDGTLSVDSFQAIPCRISSRTDTNDYCPTLLEEGSEEYARALSKVTGEWTGSNDVIDYSFMHPEEG